MDNNNYNGIYKLNSFSQNISIGTILVEHLRMGELFFISRSKESFSFFNLCEYKTPFRDSLKYFGVDVCKSLFSPAKALKIYFLKLYFFRKMESLRRVHSTFWFNRVNEWKKRTQVKTRFSSFVNKTAHQLRRRALKNKYIRDMRLFGRKFRRCKFLRERKIKSQRMLIKKWEHFFPLWRNRKKNGRKVINLKLFKWIKDRFKRVGYFWEKRLGEKWKKVLFTRVYKKKYIYERWKNVKKNINKVEKRNIKKVNKTNKKVVKKIK